MLCSEVWGSHESDLDVNSLMVYEVRLLSNPDNERYCSRLDKFLLNKFLLICTLLFHLCSY
jgi:hypothetical protein